MDIAINTAEVTPEFIDNIIKGISDFLDLAEKIALFTVFSKTDDEIVAKAKVVMGWVKEIVAKPWFAGVVEFLVKMFAKKEAA